MNGFPGLERIFNYGPDAVIAILIILVAFRLMSKFGGAFVQSQNNIAASLAQNAEAVNNLSDILNRVVIESGKDHKSIMLELRTLILETQEIRDRMDRMEMQCEIKSRN